MTFGETWRVMMRRWYLLIPAIVVAACGAFVGVSQTPASYQSQVQILLLPTATSVGDSGPGNPYLNLSASIGQTSQVVSANVQSVQTAERLARQGASASYSVFADDSLNAPVVKIVVTGSQPATVAKTLTLVQAAFTDALSTLQKEAQAPANTFISTTTITQTPAPEKLLKLPIRNGIIGGVVGLLVGMLPIPLSERRRAQNLRRTAASANDQGAARARADLNPSAAPAQTFGDAGGGDVAAMAERPDGSPVNGDSAARQNAIRVGRTNGAVRAHMPTSTQS